MAKLMKRIVTHSGKFHCDEAFACWMLLQTEEYGGSSIIRSRDPAVIESGDIVVDVGGVYDVTRRRFDHHQREFTETLTPKHKTKLSSAGLVYRHFGREVIRRVESVADDDTVELLWDRMYTKFVEGLDAVDNGISQYDPSLEANYEVTTSLPSRVDLLNPYWNDPTDDGDVQTRFMRAVEMCGLDFTSRLRMYHRAWLPARRIVDESLEGRFALHESGRIMLLESRCPWGEHLSQLEMERGVDDTNHPYYVLFGDGDDWRVQAVPVKPGSFQSRLALPAQWRGLRDDALSQAAGVENCVFIHASGFIGGAKTKDGVLALATKSLELQQQ